VWPARHPWPAFLLRFTASKPLIDFTFRDCHQDAKRRLAIVEPILTPDERQESSALVLGGMKTETFWSSQFALFQSLVCSGLTANTLYMKTSLYRGRTNICSEYARSATAFGRSLESLAAKLARTELLRFRCAKFWRIELSRRCFFPVPFLAPLTTVSLVRRGGGQLEEVA